MNREEIMNILPHRTNMLLLDDVEKQRRHLSRASVLMSSSSRDFFLMAIVPGVILCEILAQSACVLMQDAMSE